MSLLQDLTILKLFGNLLTHCPWEVVEGSSPLKKSNYMIFTRSKANFGTRLRINDELLDRVEEVKLVGLWLQSDLKWTKNIKELNRKAFSRFSMLTKLKYAGVGRTSTIFTLEV